jgi:hypothetical protein
MAKRPVKKSTRRTSKAKPKLRRAIAGSSGKASQASRDVLAGVDPEHWRARLTKMVFPKVGFLPEDVEAIVDASATGVAADVIKRPQTYGLQSVRRTKRGEVVMVPDDFDGVVQHAVRAGFYLAVREHQRELEVVPDAAKIVRDLRGSKVLADAKRSSQKQARIKTALRMHKEGKSIAEITAHFRHTEGKGSQSTVYKWITEGLLKPPPQS